MLPVRIILGSTLLLALLTTPAANARRGASGSGQTVAAASAQAKSAPPTQIQLKTGRSAQLVKAYGRLPLAFEANRGQTDPQVKFLSRGAGYTLFLTGDEAVLALRRASQKAKGKGQRAKEEMGTDSSLVSAQPALAPQVVRLRFVGANRHATSVGLDRLPGKSNYFQGGNPAKWHANVPNYRKVKYRGLYPGIDLVYYGNQRQLEYDFVLAPGADPGVIRLAVGAGLALPSGARQAAPLRIDPSGDLVIATAGGEVRFHKPTVYQPKSRAGFAVNSEFRIQNSERVDGAYKLLAGNQVGFEVARFDRSRPLVIDPALSYSTYLGGTSGEVGYSIAVDADGNAYVTGSTGSVDFPTVDPLQPATVGDFDAFVTKLDPTGTTLVYSTYLGGTGFDRGTGIALDASGNAYVTGMTSSDNFPTTSSAFQPAFGGGICGTSACSDAFVAKIQADGAALAYSTYLGGSNADFGQGIAVDDAGSAYVTGSTLSVDFPTATPLQAEIGVNSDAFVTKLSADGTALSYSTYLGGSDADFGQGIAVNAAGNAYVAGYTLSTDFTTASPLQSANAGSADAFVVELDPPGAALVYSTYFGGSGLDRAAAIALDSSENVYIVGDTNSPDFPVTSGALQTVTGGGTCGSSPCADAFVAKVNAGGASLAYATYLGGTDIDQGAGIAVGSGGDAVVTGFTRSDDFLLVSPLQAAFGGGTCDSAPCSDAFVTKIDAAGASATYSTYLGGSDTDFGQGVALDSSGNAYVTGSTSSADYPATVGVAQGARGTDSPIGDAFIAKISPADAAGLAVSPPTLEFGDQSTGFASDAQILTLTNAGSAPLTFSSLVAHGDFAIDPATTCATATPVAAGGGTCTIAVTFNPTELGDRTGDVTITDNVAGGPHVIALDGNGITPAPAVTLTPESLEFPDQDYNTTSAPLTATLKNSGTAALTISDIAVTGDFAETDGCPLTPDTLGVDESCNLTVTFTPQSTGALTGNISITDDGSNATDGKHTLGLSGNGLALFTVSADSTLQTVTRGTDSATFTITAAGPSDFTDSINLTCPTSGQATCSFDPASITVGQSSTLTVGSLTAVTGASQAITVNGISGTQTAELDLTVQFADFSLAVSPTFSTITAGDATTFTLTVTPTNGFTGSASFSCAALPLETTCSFDPATVEITGADPVTTQVTVQTTVRITSFTPPRPPGPSFPWLFLTVLSGVFASLVLITRRRSRARLLFAAAALALTLFLASCGQNYFTFTGTPPGAFGIGVTTTVGDVSHTAIFALTVR